MKAVILSAGEGTRLRPLTLKTPKSMLNLGGRPILETLVCQLMRDGFTDIIITTYYLSEKIADYLPRLSEKLPKTVMLHHHPQTQLMGTVGGISAIDSLTDEDFFLLINCDVITDMNFRQIVEFHQQETSSLTLGTYTVREKNFHLG